MALFGAEEDQDPTQPDMANADVDSEEQSTPKGDAEDHLLGFDEASSDLNVASEPTASGTLTLEQTLVNIIGEMSGVDPSEINLDAPLTGDLDISGLALWAVVSEVERGAGVSLEDSDVQTWRTPQDILDAVYAAKAASQE